jgi:hypothetical protein
MIFMHSMVQLLRIAPLPRCPIALTMGAIAGIENHPMVSPRAKVRALDSIAPHLGLTMRYPCISWWSAEQKFVQ